MSVTELFFRKLKLEMRLLHIVDRRPLSIIKLQPLSEQDFVISQQSVKQWSEDNIELYQLVLENGMAEFICNKEYLFQFYQQLTFVEQNINTIDSVSMRFTNLQILNLTRNNIQIVEYIPPNCRQLYLDFNHLSTVKNVNDHHLQLLSVSHNAFSDSTLQQIVQSFAKLRCLNISYNKICDLRRFVTTLANLSYLKILIAYSNPISMLKIYYSYITDHIELAFIDGVKYVKEVPAKEEPVKIEEKKEVKQQKKDSKKDNKKQVKVQEKIVQQPKVQPPPIQVKKQLTNQDFQRIKITIKVTNLEQHSGNLYDQSLFPADIDVKKTQTCYWLKYQLMGEIIQQRQTIISFDNTVVEGDSIRINLQSTINQTISVNVNNYQLFNQGLKISVCQIQPKMIKDTETLQLKPQIKDNQILSVQSILGGCRVDLRELHLINNKSISSKYRIFNAQVSNNPLFYDPLQNENEIINAKRQHLQKDLKSLEQARIKKAQQEELLKQQKKGKDQKKGAEKKTTKKQGKDSIVQQKKKAQKCDFPVNAKIYSVLEQQKLCKGKQLLCIDIKIE